MLAYGGSYISATGQSAQLTGPEINVEPSVFGYNSNDFNQGPDWTSATLRNTVARLHPGNVRYPGGTTANYWDWRTGGIIATINTGWPKYLASDVPVTPETFVRGIPEGSEIVYCINMARPTPTTGIAYDAPYEVLASQTTLEAKITDILGGIDAFYQAGYALRYVELGNEFYNGAVGGTDKQGGVYAGDVTLYIDHVNQIATAIHDSFPDIQLAVIGESSRGGQITPWTQAIYDALEAEILTNVDAITFHCYAGPGVSALTNADSAEQSLSVPFGKVRSVRRTDYDTAPEGLALWITEYNTWSPPRASSNPKNPGNGGPIQGTWVNGLYGATMGLLYAMMGEDVDVLDIHVLSVGKNIQWSMLAEESTLSGNGVAVGTVAKAMRGMTKAQEITFEGIPEPTFAGDKPSLYGVKFSNGQRESVVIINSTNQPKTGISIDNLFTGNAPRQLTQYYDENPTDLVSETEGITFNYNDDLRGAVNVPPFSITLIAQEQENLVANASFERVGNQWTHSGTQDVSRREAVTGPRALRLETTTQGWQSAHQTATVATGVTYDLRAQVQTALRRGRARLHVRFFDADGQEVGERVTNGGIGGEQSYQTTRLRFTTPARTARASVYLQLANGTGTAWFDDVVLTSAKEGSQTADAAKRSSRPSESRLLVYPNPVNNHQLSVDLRSVPSSSQQITLTTLQGQVVRRWVVQEATDTQLNTYGLPAGIYTLTVNAGKQSFTKRVIIP